MDPASRQQDPTPIDWAPARELLAALGIGHGDVLTFQAIPEPKGESRAKARVVHGTLAQAARQLERLHSAGCGLFYVVNRTDGLGRCIDNVVEVRALFADLDGAPLDGVRRFPLRPHAVVESSPGRFHAYWRATGVPLEAFRPLQRALAARLGGDPVVCDLPRVMRLPGTLHRKREPFRVRLVETWAGPTYTLAEFEAALGPWQPPPAEPAAGPSEAPAAVPAPSSPPPAGGGQLTDGREEVLRDLVFRAVEASPEATADRLTDAAWGEFVRRCEVGPTPESPNRYDRQDVQEKVDYLLARRRAGKVGGRRGPRLVEGVPPAFPCSAELTAEQAGARLRGAVDAFLQRAETFRRAREQARSRREWALDDYQDARMQEANAYWQEHGDELLERLLALGRPASDAPSGHRDQDSGAGGLRRREAEMWRELKAAQAGERRVRREMLRAVDEEVAREFGLSDLRRAPRLQVVATPGLGKTEAVLDALAADSRLGLTVHYFVPTLAHGDELARRCAERGLMAAVIRGRGAPDDDGEPLCHKWRAALKAGGAGLNVAKTMCRRREGDGRERLCPHHAGCPYQAQFPDYPLPGVYIFAHDSIGLPRPRRIPPPDLVVVDESALRAMVGRCEFGADRLEPAAREAALSGEPLREALLARGVDAKEARRLARLHERAIGQAEQRVSPELDAGQAEVALDALALAERRDLAAFYRRLAVELPLRRPFHGVTLLSDAVVHVDGRPERQARVEVCWPRRPELPPSVPVLLLDADADLEVNRRLWGDHLEEARIPATRRAEVVQLRSSRCSKQALLGPARDGRTRTLDKVRSIIRRLVAEGAQVLVVSNKPVRKALTGETGGVPPCTDWEGATVTHFGALRGVDRWRDCTCAVVVGREQVPPRVAEAVARAIWADDPEPLALPGAYTEALRGYRLRSGELLSVLVHVHPDPRVQRVVELRREREVVQAVDRLRLVHCDRPKKVFILCNVPLDLTVDRLVSLDELAGTAPRGRPARLRACLARFGLLPLGARDLHRLAPDLFPTRRAAQRALEKHPPTPISTLFEVGGYFPPPGGGLGVARYRLAGQRGRASRLLYDAGRWPRPEDARAALAVALGAEVITLELERVIQRPGGVPGGGSAGGGEPLVQAELFPPGLVPATARGG